MPKLVKIKAPFQGGELIEVEGYMVRLYVGNIQEKFLLQQSNYGEVFLTHYDSGMTVGSLRPIKVRNLHSYHTMTDRAAAEELLDSLVARLGAAEVLKRIKAAPKVNVGRANQ